MKSRPIYHRSMRKYKYYFFAPTGLMCRVDMGTGKSWLGLSMNKADSFEPTAINPFGNEELVTEEQARKVAPHLFK